MSAFELNIESDVKRVKRSMSRLHRDAIDKAAVRSINRTASKVNTIAKRNISKKIGLPQKVFKRSIMIAVKANRLRLLGVVKATGKHFNLIEFVAPASRFPGKFNKKRGVVAKPYGNKRVYQNTFIGRGKNSGKALVFIREGQTRQPIRGFFGPSIPKTFVRLQIVKAMRREARITFNKEFERNIRFYIARM